MEIRGKVHLMFEQSGVFKKEFKKLGYDAYDYDIQNNFGQTDYQIDLFAEIEKAYNNEPSIFDTFSSDDLLMAFFPCIYFTGYSNPPSFSLANNNYRKLTDKQKIDAILKRSQDREYFYEMLIKMVGVCLERGLRIIIENPWSTLSYLNNRTLRGDFFVKPTAYWFFNCEHTNNFSLQPNHNIKIIVKCKGSNRGGYVQKKGQ